MGKPFDEELVHLSGTLDAAFSESLHNSLNNLIDSIFPFPLLVVGSGGSLSGAHFIARLHEQATGKVAKAMTPLDLMLSTLQPDSHAVLFVTANGNNEDILNSFHAAIRREYGSIGIICANKDSKIVAEANRFSAKVNYFEFLTPTGKDGFVAVNSLLATCVWMSRGYRLLDAGEMSVQHFLKQKINLDTAALNKILERKTLVTLGGEWSWPAVLDLESKFSEVGLGNVLISDLRNFGHGRDNWFDKRGSESAMLILETPPLAKLANKTLSYLPAEYPSMIIRSTFQGALGGLDLMERIFYLVQAAGKFRSIDPGKPGVPDFGSKMYHIKFFPMSKMTKQELNRVTWIERKSKATDLSTSFIEPYFENFLRGFNNLSFSGIVFDYDGTLCDPADRFLQPKHQIAKALNKLVGSGINIGVATGRGRSVQESLRRIIDRENWPRVFVGNYNGATVLTLGKEPPKFERILSPTVQKAYTRISGDVLINTIANIEARAMQISIVPKASVHKSTIRTRISELLVCLSGLKVVESDHSIDVTDQTISKLRVVETLRSYVQSGENILTIGDQGQYGGNDFELLNCPQSLSIDKVSTSLDTCWNLSPIGWRGTDATLSIIRALVIDGRTICLSMDLLGKMGE
ncbi:MAG: HAD-IIB family hydrolase [Dehalococcoidia bacterium]